MSAVSAKAIEAMNWGRWEYSLLCSRRLERWRKAAKILPGSRVMIYDTSAPRPSFRNPFLEKYIDMYGGKLTANMLRVQQSQMNAIYTDWIESASKLWNRMVHDELSHSVDAMIYGAALHGKVRVRTTPPRWLSQRYGCIGDPMIEQPEYYERATRWQLPNQGVRPLTLASTGFDPSRNDTWSREPGALPTARSLRRRGEPPRTPRKSTT